MRKLALLVALLLVPAYAVADEHADHGAHGAAEGHDDHGGHHEGHPSLLEALSFRDLQGAIVNFALLLILANVYGAKKIRTALEERRARVAAELEEARVSRPGRCNIDSQGVTIDRDAVGNLLTRIDVAKHPDEGSGECAREGP